MVGFGRRTTPEPFVNACHTFVYLENLGEQGSGEAGRAAGADQAEPGAGECGLTRVTALDGTEPEGTELEGTKLEGRLKNLDVQLREAINACLAEHPAEDSGPGREGWVNISLLTPVLRRRAPDWDVRNYGVNKSAGLSGLLKLPELSELFELDAQPQEAADRDSKQVLTVLYSVRVKPGVTWVSP